MSDALELPSALWVPYENADNRDFSLNSKFSMSMLGK